MQQERLSFRGRLYVWGVILSGVFVVVHSVAWLWTSPVNFEWFVLAGLTLLSGSFTVRIPTIHARLSVSETFVFAAVLLFGPAAATVIVVLDTLVISLWLKATYRNATRVLFNMAAPSVAIWIAAHVFFVIADIEPLSRSPQRILNLVLPLFVLAACYFVLNSLLIARAVAFERSASTFAIWRNNFLWLSLNYFSGASVAALLLPYLQSAESEFIRIIGIILPLLLISYLTFKTALGRVEDANTHLTELNRLYLSTIETLAMAIDAKDQITHGHIRRVQTYAVRLARAMGASEAAQIRAIEAAALLHDMGKLAVPEYILNKPGPLSPSEFEKMKLHASVGADILSAIEFPYPVVPIVRHHHENWDGTGYPAGLAGTDIPIGARILSVVDCFDALTSDRPYRPKLPDREALRILHERRGTMYDPLVVDTFVRIYPELSTGDLTETADALQTIAELSATNRAAIAVRREQFEQIAASRSETLVLLQLAQGLGGCRTAIDAADQILGHVRSLIPTSLAALYVVDHRRHELTAVRAMGDHSGLLVGMRIPLAQRLSGWVAANQQSIRNSDAVLDLGDAARDTSPRLRSCMAAPIATAGESVAVLTLYSTAVGAFTEDHQRILEAIADQSAEPLRGVLNRSQTAFAEPLFEESGSNTVAFVYVRVLERHDHSSIQPQLVAKVREKLKKLVRPSDVLLQPSPLETLVVIRGLDPSAVAAAAARVERSLQQPSVDSDADPQSIYVSASHVTDEGTTNDALLRLARGRYTSDAESLGNSASESVH